MTHKIVVIGGKGFLGGHICQHFSERGWDVISIGRGDINPYAHQHYQIHLPHSSFTPLLAEIQPSLCVNCGGRASVADSMTDPLGDFNANTGLVIFLLDAIRQSVPNCIFINLSSASVYGNPSSLPIDENTAIRPVSSYGYHKYMEELVIQEYAFVHNIQTAALRIFSAYGERLHRQVIWDLTCKVIRANGKPLQVWGTGDESRDFIHGQDVARAVELVALQKNLQGDVYNLASGQETTIRDLAKLIVELAGHNSPLVFDQSPPNGYALRWYADITKIQQIGFEPSVSLMDGLKRVIQAAVTKLKVEVKA